MNMPFTSAYGFGILTWLQFKTLTWYTGIDWLIDLVTAIAKPIYLEEWFFTWASAVTEISVFHSIANTIEITKSPGLYALKKGLAPCAFIVKYLLKPGRRVFFVRRKIPNPPKQTFPL